MFNLFDSYGKILARDSYYGYLYEKTRRQEDKKTKGHVFLTANLRTQRRAYDTFTSCLTVRALVDSYAVGFTSEILLRGWLPYCMSQ